MVTWAAQLKAGHVVMTASVIAAGFQFHLFLPLQSISQNFLTREEQRSVTCKSVVNCHDLHSELKIETGKLGCE